MLVGTEGRNEGGGTVADAGGGTGGMHSPVPLPPWPLSLPPAPPAPFPSGTCYSCNAKSCGSQIRPVQGPSEELQPRAQLLIKN